MPELVLLKNGLNFDCDKPKNVIAIEIWTIFNETSCGIQILAIEKIITFFESRKNLPL